MRGGRGERRGRRGSHSARQRARRALAHVDAHSPPPTPQIEWFCGPHGVAMLRPREHRAWRAAAALGNMGSQPPPPRVDGLSEQASADLAAFAALLASDDAPTREAAARAWGAWESVVSGAARPWVGGVDGAGLGGADAWTFDDAAGADRSLAPSFVPGDPARPASLAVASPSGQDPGWTARGVAQARLTCHFARHGGFGLLDDVRAALLSSPSPLAAVPATLVQGLQDCVTPPATALALRDLYGPLLRVDAVRGGGHSQYSPGIARALIEALDRTRAAAPTGKAIE